jgi:hypothetical protein
MIARGGTSKRGNHAIKTRSGMIARGGTSKRANHATKTRSGMIAPGLNHAINKERS